MGKKYLIDTNIIIEFAENKLSVEAKQFVSTIIDNTPCFSVINKIELLGFSDVKDEIVELIASSLIISLSDEIIEKTIAIRKIHHIKLPDAIIAATVLTQGLILVTRNTADFKNIKGLKLENPWDK